MLGKEFIEMVNNKHQNGEKLTRRESIFYQGEYGTRKSNLLYSYNNDELLEYAKCYESFEYFVSKFDIKLSDFQRNWISKDKFKLNLTSRQSGYTTIISLNILWKLIFSKWNHILLCSVKLDILCEFRDKIFHFYKKLPFHLKVGIVSKNKNQISFDNMSKIRFSNYSNVIDYVISSNYNSIYLNEFEKCPESINEKLLKCLYPTVSAISNAELIISSDNIGDNIKSIIDKSRVNKPKFKITETYWNDIANRNKKWQDEIIDRIGKDNFIKYYNLGSGYLL